MSLIAELNRRNVFRVALLYIVGGWFGLQLLDLILTGIGAGDWVYRFLFAMGVICFPLLIIFSYIYEITPQGLRKEHQVERAESITRRTGRKITKATWVFLGLSVLIEIIRWITG